MVRQGLGKKRRHRLARRLGTSAFSDRRGAVPHPRTVRRGGQAAALPDVSLSVGAAGRLRLRDLAAALPLGGRGAGPHDGRNNCRPIGELAAQAAERAAAGRPPPLVARLSRLVVRFPPRGRRDRAAPPRPAVSLGRGGWFTDCSSATSCRGAGCNRLRCAGPGRTVAMLETSAVEEVGDFFRRRRPPGRTGRCLFRQTALEYIRLHPSFVSRAVVARALADDRAGGGLRAGGGDCRHPSLFPENTFEGLDEPLGQVKPRGPAAGLEAYFEAAAASRQYAVLTHRDWSLVESFRRLALCHAVALWPCRSAAVRGGRSRRDCVQGADRGQSTTVRPYAPRSTGRRHGAARSLNRLGNLPRLIAWYAR